MVASSVEELRVSLETEAEELARQRERLETELAEVERQLAARRNAVEHLALIRPLTGLAQPPATPAAPVAPVGDVPVPEAPAAGPPNAAEKPKRVPAPRKRTRVQPVPVAEVSVAEVSVAEVSVAEVPAAIVAVVDVPAAESTEQPAPAKPARATKAKAKAEPKAKAAPEAARPIRTTLRDDIAALLEATGEPMNVRQLTEALGETATKSRMEGVRTSTEGLVKAGRARKAGRGLFTGPAA